MLNFYEGVRDDPSYNKLEIGDLLFAEYTCGIGNEKLGLWTHSDYLVNVVTGKKTWHTSDGVWVANPGETLFFKKGAAIVEQHFELDFCLLMFFIPDDFVRSTVREIAGSLTAALASAAAIKSAVRVENDVGLSAFFQSSVNLPTGQAGCQLSSDFTLARGLNYYTGIIFEVKAKNVQIGSIGGGGRYDDLTGLFGVPNIPGVGISFGVDRIYDVMEELNLFPADLSIGSRVLFFNLGEKESAVAYPLIQMLRQKNIATELYHEVSKMDKQFKYAERKKIPYVVIIGEKELQQGTCNVKELATGKQSTLSRDVLLNFPFE